MIRFALESSPSDAGPRAGVLRTPHGDVPTPAYMPVGTQATVKTVTPEELRAAGVGMVLANAYHLYLRPGHERIRRLGGLHAFMGWDGPILTDSGGYQVFSLGNLRRVTDQGVTFRSHLDGSEHVLTPEAAVAVQEALGADVIMAFDEPPPPTASRQEAAAATERTHRWAERCLAALRTEQALFAICQGGMFEDLRRESARFVAGLDVPGCAVGGLSIGEPKEITWRMLAASLAELPRERPRYLMGVGSPEDVVRAAGMGVDLFDCVLPTRVARNGACFTPEGRINLKNARWAEERGPVDPACDCYTCARFSLAYLHHLFRAEELLAYRLATIHNLRFTARLMADLRAAITAGRYREFAAAFLARYRPADEEARREQKAKWLAARVLSGPPPEEPSDGGAGAPAEG